MHFTNCLSSESSRTERINFSILVFQHSRVIKSSLMTSPSMKIKLLSVVSPVFSLLSPVSYFLSSSLLSPEYKAHCLKGRDTRLSILLLRRVCREVCWLFGIWCHVNTNLFKIRNKWNQRNQILDKFNSVLEPNSCETLSSQGEDAGRESWRQQEMFFFWNEPILFFLSNKDGESDIRGEEMSFSLWESCRGLARQNYN